MADPVLRRRPLLHLRQLKALVTIAQSSGNAAEIQKWQERQRQVTAARPQPARKPAAAGSQRADHLKCRPSFTPNSLVTFQGS